MIVVLTADVIISALWTHNKKAEYIISQIIAGNLKLCHDYKILTEYEDVLSRPRFQLTRWQINSLLGTFDEDGISVVPIPLPKVSFKDESDRKFYEVAKFYDVPLVTGNVKNFPQDDNVMTVAEYYAQLIDG